ncbi:hypothetical protein WDZ16_09295 [Pseudokineococcus marinus]|uniref:Uncharacterized protein n=1 Tax=Pseudokineococcus marinus TaxID=351215 RepID=A0A849BMI1_9ACTN|nr:hypothetical protein [Pseudokineococcus marinus]NNH22553.1 hypothetical protein [Pseudokineococcus marinus]
MPTDHEDRGPGSWDPVLPRRHPIAVVRRAALVAGLALLLVMGLPVGAGARSAASWAVLACAVVVAGGLAWAVVKNRRLRRGR